MNPGRITKAMIDAGAAAVAHARELGHDDKATAHLVLTAMLAASNWPRAIRYRPEPDKPVQYTWDGRRLPRNPLKRSDFDAEGKRLIGYVDGKPSYQYLCNIWYLQPKYTGG